MFAVRLRHVACLMFVCKTMSVIYLENHNTVQKFSIHVGLQYTTENYEKNMAI